MIKTKGRIVNIEKRQNRVGYLRQGIEKHEQYRFDSFPGGNGTYVTGGEYLGTSLNVKVYVFDLEKSFDIDVYDDIKKITGKNRISAKLLNTIESHKGEKIDVTIEGFNRVKFDVNILLK